MQDETMDFKIVYGDKEIKFSDLCEAAELHPEVIQEEIDREFIEELKKDPAFAALKKEE